MKKCPKCHAEMEDSEQFCSNCGAAYAETKPEEKSAASAEEAKSEAAETEKSNGPHEETKFCSKCGAPLSAETQFCPKCGSPVGKAAKPKNEIRIDTKKIIQTIDSVPYRVLQLIIIVLLILVIILTVQLQHPGSSSANASASSSTSETIAEMETEEKFPSWSDTGSTSAPTAGTNTSADDTVYQITAWPTDGYCSGVPAPTVGTFQEGYGDGLGNRQILIGNITYDQTLAYIETVKNAGFNLYVQTTGNEENYGFMSANSSNVVFECIYMENQALFYIGDMDHATDGIVQ